MRNRTLFFKVFMLFLGWAGAGFFIPRLWAEQDVLERFLDQMKNESVQTGDLIFWASNQMDSVLIQKFTEGPYSHTGILHVEEGGKIWVFDAAPGEGLRRSLLESQFEKERNTLIALALVRYRGQLDRKEIDKRLREFWRRNSQIRFDHAMALEEGDDYASLLKGGTLSLYCTEFVYRVYEGNFSGPPFFENDYPRVYMQKDLFISVPVDQEIVQEFQLWLGIRPVEQFQKWLSSHHSRILITANGMLRGGGFTVVFEVQDQSRLKPWARRFLEAPKERAETKEKS